MLAAYVQEMGTGGMVMINSPQGAPGWEAHWSAWRLKRSTMQRVRIRAQGSLASQGRHAMCSHRAGRALNGAYARRTAHAG